MTKEQHDRYVPLRVQASDAEDLCIISACLQDALIPVSGITYNEELQKFSLIVNRFCWECHVSENEADNIFNRVNSFLCFSSIKEIKYKGFNPKAEETIICLLTIQQQDESTVILTCSEDVEIKLSLEKLDCHLRDIEEPYPTVHKPCHQL